MSAVAIGSLWDTQILARIIVAIFVFVTGCFHYIKYQCSSSYVFHSPFKKSLGSLLIASAFMTNMLLLSFDPSDSSDILWKYFLVTILTFLTVTNFFWTFLRDYKNEEKYEKLFCLLHPLLPHLPQNEVEEIVENLVYNDVNVVIHFDDANAPAG